MKTQLLIISIIVILFMFPKYLPYYLVALALVLSAPSVNLCFDVIETQSRKRVRAASSSEDSDDDSDARRGGRRKFDQTIIKYEWFNNWDGVAGTRDETLTPWNLSDFFENFRGTELNIAKIVESKRSWQMDGRGDPVSALEDLIRSKLTRLRLAGIISDEGYHPYRRISQAIKASKTLEELELSPPMEYLIDEMDVEHLKKAIAGNTVLKKLSIMKPIGFNSMKTFFNEGLRMNRHLTFLHLSFQKFLGRYGTNPLEQLAEALQQIETLETLVLSFCEFQTGSFLVAIEAIIKETKLKRLNMQGSTLEDVDATDNGFNDMLGGGAWGSLEIVELADIGLSSLDINSLRYLFFNRNLKRLDLRNNFLGQSLAVQINQYLPQHITVDLRGNEDIKPSIPGKKENLII